jgi:hypothetical protein
MHNYRIEITISGRIAATAGITLADSSSAMNEHFIEPAPARLIFGLVPKMPFPEDAGGITGGLKQLSQGHSLEAHAFAFGYGVGHAGTKLVPASHQ